MRRKSRSWTRFSTWCLLLPSLLTACQAVNSAGTSPDDCLPPLFKFSFPYREEGITDTAHSLPSIPGITQQVDEEGVPVTVFEGKLVVRGADEIWLVEPLMRYTPSTRVAREYVILGADGLQAYPKLPFLGSDGTLYVQAVNSTFTGILVARYDDQHDKFEVITAESDVFTDNGAGARTVHEIVEDRSGNFWFIYNDILTRFNPMTLEAEHVLGREQGYVPISTLVISPGNSLWTAAEVLGKNGGDDAMDLGIQVIRYDISTGDIQQFGAPPGLQESGWELFLDHRGRLWFNDFGYLELNKDGSGTWYQVIRSPIFISDRSGNYRYVWRIPEPKLETRERHLWFTFSGLARLDLETNQWCLVSRTPVSSVAKDGEENLWFLSDNQLYKYDFDS